MSQTLETLFADICAKHDLTNISVHFSSGALPIWAWDSYAHWPNDNTFAYGHGSTPQEAMEAAIKSAAEKRAGNVIIPASITMEMAA